MDYLVEYDRSSPLSIEKYSQKMIGKSFREIWEEDLSPLVREGLVEERGYYGSSIVSDTKRNKGNLGQIIEERFFHYQCNGDSRPDFHEAGVELKVTPYKKNKDGSLAAKESFL